MSSRFQTTSSGQASSQSIAKAASNMVLRGSHQSLGLDQTLGSNMKGIEALPQPGFVSARESIGPGQPAQDQNHKYSTGTSNHAMQSYKAYDPRNAGPMIAPSERPDSRAPSMSSLADQNAQLTKKLKALRTEHDEPRNALEKMLSELLKTESSLEEKEAEISKQSVELVTLREDVARLSAELKDKTPQFSKMEQLFKKREAANSAKKDGEIRALQEEVDRLSTV